ncbi:MAG: hypothetical protein CML07_04510 [Psychrobacter sp.]|jgi:lysylphosphatidylglycerol synthetase-like protein (DUF2156 family)|nr:hypothetical protein [Psychrobacter sp.]
MSYMAIAQVDMRPNLAVATVILIVGACVLVLLSHRKDGDGNKSRWWIPLASLVAGPVIAFALWAADVFVLHPDMYPTAFQGDAMATLSRTMILGTFVGVVASVVFAIVLKVRRAHN